MASFQKRYACKTGTEEECLKFAQGTVKELEGWWYHACQEDDAKAFSAGTKVFDADTKVLTGKDRISFTRDPKGAARNLANWERDRWVIRAMINANPRQPTVYLAEGENTGGYLWAHVADVTSIMIELGSARERDDDTNKEQGEDKENSQPPSLLPDPRKLQRF